MILTRISLGPVSVFIEKGCVLPATGPDHVTERPELVAPTLRVAIHLDFRRCNRVSVICSIGCKYSTVVLQYTEPLHIALLHGSGRRWNSPFPDRACERNGLLT